MDTGWTLRAPDGNEYPATVPGCVHTDLMAAGAIEDPHLGDNEARTQWIGWADWRYRTRFVAEHAPGDQVDLVFHGLDTVAAVSLNGTPLGRTENMHRGYRFPIAALLAPPDDEAGDETAADETAADEAAPAEAAGVDAAAFEEAAGPAVNELVVEFASAERFAEARSAETGGPRPNPFGRTYPAIRKMACNFGWDWGPDLVTAGIWRPVEVHRWRIARLDEVRPVMRHDEDGWTVEVTVDLVYAGDPASVTVTARVAGAQASVQTAGRTAVLRLAVDSPDLWWPTGYGEQPLYWLRVDVRRDGEVLDEWRRRVGFRTVELDTSPDEIGSAFVLRVNGRPVFARGVNWIPDDTFVTRVGPARYRERLGQALAANVNLVRVWGGGLYESDAFYDVCDELGLLVWQDFPFACAAYAEDERLAAEVEAEARENIVRLCPHPSLILWNGNNENIWGWFDWDWQASLAGRTWGERYYLELLPRLVARLDPSRPYWPGSPYSGSMDIHPNDDRHGVSHVWDVWNEKDYLAYRQRTPRFVAEFGYEGPPTWSTYRRGIGDTGGMHQKALDGNAKLERGLTEHFGKAGDFDDWLFLTQLIQARAIQVGVTHFRSAQPRCMGTIWWQLNDCWPGPSWAVVDGDGRRKPAWYALRDAYRPRSLSIQPADSGLKLVLVNDTDLPWTGTATVSRYDFDGTVRASRELVVDCAPRGVRRVPLDNVVTDPERPDRELLRATLAEATVPGPAPAPGSISGPAPILGPGSVSGLAPADWFYLPDRELSYPPAEFEVEGRPVPDGWEVDVHAATLLRDVCLFPDRLDSSSTVDHMLVTLLPGEHARFRVRSTTPLPGADLGRSPVLRCANDAQR
ncbi:glycoside hydrolase family 2 protein [Rugosimonospora acidiphila]|uniref:beta-mannosidase n=1 Tax=Rugosimonospora acidiphila TaxID=556531 RepID=A0ABP9RVR3_9ACTN